MAPPRFRRLLRGDAMVMVPLDHGASMGPLPGLEDPARTLQRLGGHFSCITAHKGWVGRLHGDHGLLMHLSAGSDTAIDPLDKRIVSSVEDALRAGCDGVSVHINVGSPTEARQIEEVGRVSSACQQWSMPLVAMMYPRGPGVDPTDPRRVAHAARLGAELGADAVKVPYCDEFGVVVDGCGVPVVVAGGPQRDEGAFLAELRQAREAGARGASVGRNIFQHPEPARLVRAIADVFQ